MLFHEEKPSQDHYIIKSYEPGSITVNQITYTHSIILSPSQLLAHWAPQTIDDLKNNDLEIISNTKPEVFILGTGIQQHFPPTALFRTLIENNIGYEVMDTRAACRTYNLLASEGRKVMAGLIIR